MRKHVTLPLAAIVLGAAGCYLRQKELATGFDLNGLAIPGNRWALALIVLSAVAAVLLALLVFRLKPREELDASALGLRGPAYGAVTCVASLVLLAAAVLGLLALRAPVHDRLRDGYLAAFAAVAAICTAVFSLTIARGGDLKKTGIVATVPVLFLCFWLIVAYREQAANPVTLSFVYAILAIVCGTLGFYFAASMVFARPRPRPAVYFGLMGVYFTLVSVEETASAADFLCFAFLALYLLCWSVCLLRNAFRK